MIKNFSRPPHEVCLEHLIMATNAANNADKTETDYHLDEAKQYAEMHKKRLDAQGQAKAGVDYIENYNIHANRVIEVLSSRMKKAGDCKKDHSNLTEKCQDCGYMIKRDLEKGWIPTNNPASPARKEYMRTGNPGNVQSNWNVTKPGKDPRYDYKNVTDLHPEDQTAIHHQYTKQNVGHYEYPVDKQTGRLAVARRAPITGTATPPTQTPSAYGSQLKPEAHHMEGASVRINAPGHAADKRLGVVRKPNPSLPGKVGVQIGSAANVVYVEHHQVKPAKPVTKVEKALVSLYAIKKMFMKA